MLVDAHHRLWVLTASTVQDIVWAIMRVRNDRVLRRFDLGPQIL